MTTTAKTKRMKLGATGPEVFPLALGCMGMGAASFYGDSEGEVAAIEAEVPAGAVAGTRYAEPLMKHLDSER